MNELLSSYAAIVNGTKLLTILGLIAIDTALGIAVAVKNCTFKWSELTRFMDTSTLPLVGGYFLIGIFALLEPNYAIAVPAAWFLIDTKLVADCVNKFKLLGVIRKGNTSGT